MIEVVSGALIHETGALLFGKRRPDRLRPGLWELPGGKVETSNGRAESPEAALVREWREELCLAVEVGPFIAHAMFELERVFSVALYEVRETVTQWSTVNPMRPPQAIDHDELRWWSIHKAVEVVPCSPGFYVHYGALRRYLDRRRDGAPTWPR